MTDVGALAGLRILEIADEKGEYSDGCSPAWAPTW